MFKHAYTISQQSHVSRTSPIHRPSEHHPKIFHIVTLSRSEGSVPRWLRKNVKSINFLLILIQILQSLHIAIA
jgi:TRAP-type mannitol/chloroaromatic compound transport system permease small subunit